MNYLPAGGASRSIAPNLIHTSCDGTILAGVFKYSDAINNPDGHLLLSQKITSEHKCNKVYTLFNKRTFYPKKPKNPPPPNNPPIIINPKNRGGGPPPFEKSSTPTSQIYTRQTARPLRPDAGARAKMTLVHTPSGPLQVTRGAIREHFLHFLGPKSNGENRGFSCIFVFQPKIVFFRVF